MSQSFFLRSINSDLSVGGALFNRKLLEETGTAASQVVSLTASQTLDAYAWTEPGIPGAAGGAGDYTVSIHVTSGATQINNSVRVARVNSSGVVQAESGFSTPDVGNAGVKVHEIPSVDLGTWAEGDRLRVQYRFVNTDSMMTRELTIELNTVDTEVITPWVEAGEIIDLSGSGSNASSGSGNLSVEAAAVDLSGAGAGASAGIGSMSVVRGLVGSGGNAASGSGELLTFTFDPANADVTPNGSTAELTWSASPTPGVVDYQVFRRTPQTGDPFEPGTDTPVATGITDLFYDDVGLDSDDYDWQVFGRVPS